MKIMKTTLLALSIICLAASHTAYAQDYVAPPVTISQDKVKMDGKLYYSHVVLEKQTLYSISKAYGVSMDDIYEANPSLKETGLKKNAIILIPVPETGAMAEGQEIRDKAAGRKARTGRTGKTTSSIPSNGTKTSMSFPGNTESRST